MDIKKVKEADLERGRTTWFLLGLVLVLAVAYVALEWNDASSDSPDDVAELPKEPLADDLYVPMAAPDELLRLVSPPPAPPAEAEELRIVDDMELTDELAELAAEQQSEGGDTLGAGSIDAESETDEAPALAQETPPAVNPMRFRVVENLPQFPGGATELMKWLTRNLRYPRGAQRQKIEGRVVVRFIVEADGSISGLEVIEKLHPLCDNEALRVMRTMPRWAPGIENDRPCRTMVCIPIVFKL